MDIKWKKKIINNPDDVVAEEAEGFLAAFGEKLTAVPGVKGLIKKEIPEGKVALVMRGSISFADKCSNAANAGAVACIIFNNTTGSIGIVYVGGLASDGKTPKDTRTEEQKLSLRTIIDILKAFYPRAKVYGHRDFAKKDCPCFDASKEFN